MLPERFRRALRSSHRPAAVVLGGGPSGLAVARALSRHRIPVLGVRASRPRPTGFSSAWEIAVLPELFREDPLPLLLGLAEAIGSPLRSPVLIPTHDLFVDIMSRHSGALRAAFRFELPVPEALGMLRSKIRFAEEAVRRGWAIPRTVPIRDLAGLARACEELSFPVILKPAFGTVAFRTHSPVKARLCRTPLELRLAHGEFSGWECETVAQEFIPGGDDALWFSLHYHDAELRELGGFTGRKLRQWPPLCGNTSLAVPAEAPELARKAGELLRTCGCSGFGAIEYKHDPRDGRYYVIEPTAGRPDLQIGLAVANGVDLISRAYSQLTQIPLPEARRPSRPRKWILFREDLQAAAQYRRGGALTLAGYVRSIRGPWAFAIWRPLDFRMYPSLIRGLVAFMADIVRGRFRRWRQASGTRR